MSKTINNQKKFVVNQDKKIAKRINDDLSIIQQIILENFNYVESIILAGGFGRGEGSVLIHEKEVQPINDYDLYVITKFDNQKNLINKVRKQISSIVKIRQVDLEVIPIKKLKSLKPTMANYDLKYASYIFYGNNQILNSIPTIDSQKLSLKEGRTPLLLYLISIIQAYPHKQEKDLSINEKFWMYQQICKSILGWSTALLILEGKYHSSYIEREKIFKSSFKNKEWCQLVENATNFKVSPHLFIQDNISKLWNLNKHIHLTILEIFLSKYYSIDFNKLEYPSNWLSIIKKYNNDYENILRKVYGFASRNKAYNNRIKLTIIEILLLASCKSQESQNKDLVIDSNLFKIAIKEINKFDRSKKIENNWESAIKFCIDNDPNCNIWKEKGTSVFYT